MPNPPLQVSGDGSSGRYSNHEWGLALIVMALCALIIRYCYLTNAMVDHPIRGDATQYYSYAWNLLHHGTFSMALPGAKTVTADSFRDPGYPVFLAAWMEACQSPRTWYWVVLTSQSLLGVLTVIMLVQIARNWLPDRWLFAAGLLMAVWPHSITINGYLLSETLFSFLCAAALVLFVSAQRRSSINWMIASGLAFSLAALTNATLLPFAPLLALYAAIRHRVSARMAIALAASALLIPACWNIRNAQLLDGASSNGRALTNLIQGSWPEYHDSYRKALRGMPEGVRISQAIQNEVDLTLAHPVDGLRLMKARIAGEPLRYFAWYLSKPFLFWDWSIRIGQGDIYIYPTYSSPFLQNPLLRALASLCRAANPMLLILMLIGCVGQLVSKDPHPTGEAAALLVLYATAVYSLLQAEPRYAIPYRGLEILLAASALWRLVQVTTRWRDGRSSS